MRWIPRSASYWRPWFAWRPAMLITGERVWLETIERTPAGNIRGRAWLYRLPGTATNLTSTRTSAPTGTDIPSDPGVEP